MILFSFIIWEAGCKGKLFFIECAVRILRVYCFEELEIILPKLFLFSHCKAYSLSDV